MTEKKVPTTVYLTRKQADGLARLAFKTNVPAAVYIRQGVDHVLHFYCMHKVLVDGTVTSGTKRCAECGAVMKEKRK
jgi:Glu-tRNA(Gln) amidotransferase subunit E-like FAD-binding protein